MRRKNYHSKRDSNCDTSPCRKEAAERPRYQNGVNPFYVQLDSKPPKERGYKGANGHHEILLEGQSSDSVIDELEVATHHPIDTEKDVKPVKITLHEVADKGKRTSRSSPRSEEAKKGLRVTFENECKQCDAEERIIDRLLMHYSMKPSTYEPGRLSRKLGSHQGHQIETDLSKHEEEDPEVRPPCPPQRSISLPPEQTTAAEMPAKAIIRAASLPPGSCSSRARHVHPKLPEYDDLAARLASLRGT
ncbi:hypothetical protein MLD38_005724 [Melastoma candidum]|uniref:Uncharacterized protein n=1 Tax=Melastoma candidum TaxID=119954 RepID=A0ACB9RK64_9MYRT|nr:hypothetical protein MLD38_005724 [Melastoma candidum]